MFASRLNRRAPNVRRISDAAMFPSMRGGCENAPYSSEKPKQKRQSTLQE
jgi:hypothetical protein